MQLGDFFSQEAGQRRRAWLEEKQRQAAESLRYALGPQLYPRVETLVNLAALFSPGQDVIDAHRAGDDLLDWKGPVDAAGNASALAAALGSMLLPGGVSGYRQGFEDLVEEGVKAHKSGRLNIFAGPMATTADLRARDRAIELETAGVDRGAIWRETGWFRGVDGRWRHEIDDSATTASLPRVQRSGELPHMVEFRDALNHADLHAAYPQLGDVAVFSSATPGFRGNFSGTVGGTPSTAMMTIGESGRNDPSTLLHETQHAIQQIEGFARGGAPEMPKPGTPGWRVFEELRGAENQPPIDFETFLAGSGLARDEARSMYDRYIRGAPERSDDVLRRDASVEAYKRLAGEVEARNVEARRHMTAKERRDLPPWTTQDRPGAQQIIRHEPSGEGATRGFLSSVADLFR